MEDTTPSSGGTMDQNKDMSAAPAGGDMNYAGFFARWGALIVDSVLLSVIYGIFAGIATAVNYSAEAAVLGIGWLVWIAFWFYNMVYLHVKDGASLGKKMFKIKVVRADGSEFGWGPVLLREIIGRGVNGFTSSIGYLVAAFTPKKQGLHDYIAKTVVVKR